MQPTSLANHHIEPFTGQVLLRLHDGRSSDSLVVLPDGSRGVGNPYGEVIAIGKDVDNMSVGDKLIFMPSTMLIQIVLNGEKFVFVDYKAILGKYVENANDPQGPLVPNGES